MQQYNNFGTILLVDDHLSLLRSTAFLLDVTGFSVITATNGAEALKLMETCRPDFIISDVDMPVMDGFDFLQAVRQDYRWRRIPFMFASEQYELEDLLYGLDLGANDYIPKPFDIYDILDGIQRTAPQLIKSHHRMAS